MLSSLPEYEGHSAPSHDAVVLGLATAWPRSSWASSSYTAALHGMAGLHAVWWGRVQDDSPWPLLSEVYDPEPTIEDARQALLNIERESWTSKLLGEGGVAPLLGLLEEPSLALELLRSAPVTLIAPTGAPPEPMESDHYVCAGPAAYDLASFYASSRWLYGRTPMGLAETRNAYLYHLGALLNDPLDHALFDITLDAARCWSFALGWARTIAAQPPALLARAHIFRLALAEPALASLRRLQRM